MKYIILVEGINNELYQVEKIKYDSDNNISYISFSHVYDNFFDDALKFNEDNDLFDVVKTFLINSIINNKSYCRLKLNTISIKYIS